MSEDLSSIILFKTHQPFSVLCTFVGRYVAITSDIFATGSRAAPFGGAGNAIAEGPIGQVLDPKTQQYAAIGNRSAIPASVDRLSIAAES